MLAADALDLGPIGRGRDDHAAGALDRLGDEGCDLVRADLLDRALELARRPQPERLGRLPRRPRHTNRAARCARCPGSAVRPARASAPCRRARRRPWWSRDSRCLRDDDDRLSRLALRRPVVAHHADDRVVRFRARAGEEDAIESGRRDLREDARELDRRQMGRLEEGVVVGQFLHLTGDGVDHLLPAIADIDVPQARHAVDDAVAVGIPQIDALCLDDDADAFGIQALRVGEGVQMMRGVERRGAGAVVKLVW